MTVPTNAGRRLTPVITYSTAEHPLISHVHNIPRLSANSSVLLSILLSLLSILFRVSVANLRQYSTDLDPRITSLPPPDLPPCVALDRVRQYVGIHKSLLGMTNSPKAGWAEE